jgi:hypothetical protein
MAERKTDFFGTFLDTVSSSPTAVQRGLKQAPPERPVFGGGTPLRPPALDPLNEVLKALIPGPQSMKDLIRYTDNSLSAFLSVSGKLEDLGLAERINGDALRLTVKGREVAAVLG